MDKAKVHEVALTIVNEKIANALCLIDEAQEAANNDTKSSAGDKHETSRAMAMLEKDKGLSQLAVANKLKQLLVELNPKVKSKSIGVGSLIKANIGWFYVSVGIGRIKVSGSEVFCISLASPIGQVLLGKQVFESISFNDKTFEIEELV